MNARELKASAIALTRLKKTGLGESGHPMFAINQIGQAHNMTDENVAVVSGLLLDLVFYTTALEERIAKLERQVYS